MSIIAFSIVFLVIIGLMLLMMGLKYFVGMVNSEGTEAALSQTAPVTEVPVITGASLREDELVAVITAAIKMLIK